MENSKREKIDTAPRESLTGEHVIVSVNPKAGAGCSRNRAEQLVTILSKQGLRARIETDLDKIGLDACLLAKKGNLRALVGVGGDGTAAELANRITPEVPLVIMPAGTENLLARHIGWPKSPERLAEVIVGGRKTCMDIGRAGNRLFLLMLSCGVDADVVYRLDQGRAGHISHASYIGPIFKSVCHYKYPKIEISYDPTITKGETPLTPTPDNGSSATWVVISNTPRYGGGFWFSPKADETDGLFDVCEFRGSGFLKSLYFLMAAKFGKSHKVKNCVTCQTTRIRLTSKEPIHYQIDGDPGGTLPVEIELLPKALTILVPPSKV